MQVGRGRQIELLGAALDPEVAAVHDGYLTSDGVVELERLAPQLSERFEQIRVGVHTGAEVVLGAGWNGPVSTPAPTIAQVLTSTVALGGYSRHSPQLEAACRPLLRAAYLGTLLAAVALEQHTVVLTSIGGGAFGNPAAEIAEAIRWALGEVDELAPSDLHVVLNLWTSELGGVLENEVEERGGQVVLVNE